MEYIQPIAVRVREALATVAAAGGVAALLAAVYAWRGRWRLPVPNATAVVWALAAAYFAFFTAVTLARHYAMATCGLDLGYYDNVIWQFGRGHFFRQTLVPTHWYAQPFAPILVALAPLSYLFRDAAYLLPIQALSLAAGVVLVYLVARPDRRPSWPAAALAAAFAFSPALHGGNLYDFHDRALGVPLALAAFYFFSQKKFRAGLVFTVLVALTREELALHAVALAAWGGVAAGRRKAGFVAAAALAAYFLFAVLVYPKLTYAPDAKPWENWYATWHLKYFPLNPHQEVPDASFLLRKASYLAVMVLPLAAFLPAAGGAMVTVITPLAVPALSSLPQTSQLGCQYPLSVLPFLFGAAALGLRRLLTASGPSRPARTWLITAGALAAVLAQLAFVGLFAERYYKYALGAAFPKPRDRTLARVLPRVKPGVPICADDPFTAHLAHRRYAYLFKYAMGVDLPAPPRAMLLNRRLHPFNDFPLIVKAAIGWKLGLAELTPDYAYFDDGPGRYGIFEMATTWYGSIEEWQGTTPDGGRVVNDPLARDGRAALAECKWHYNTEPEEAFLPGDYVLVFRLRPADPARFCHIVFDVEIKPFPPTKPPWRARLDTDILASKDYRPYSVVFATEDRFNLFVDVHGVSPFYLDGVTMQTDAYELRWGRKMPRGLGRGPEAAPAAPDEPQAPDGPPAPDAR